LDLDGSGFLEKEEVYPMFHKICYREGWPECLGWHVDYIMSLMDENGDGKLELQEVFNNYRLIIKQLS
jgi:hypothetical protein